MREKLGIKSSIIIVLKDTVTGFKRVIRTKNLITDAGDLYYAQRGIDALPTNFTNGSAVFDAIMELYNGASAAPDKANDRSDLVGLVTGSGKAMDSTYPKLNDDDTDNEDAGVDIITYRVTYAKAEANAAGIADVILTNPSPGASEPLLMHAEFAAPFEKTASMVLKVFLNHQMNGV